MVLLQYGAVLVDIQWYWFSRWQYWSVLGGTGSEVGDTQYSVLSIGYWLIHDGTGSVGGSSCWYFVAVDQYKLVMFCPRWYWVSIGRYWLVLGGTGSVEGGTRLV